ncbi:MAG: glycosyltransferase family 39 protein [bacterium]|nr:glycosyltransferase family 39 protein [bacterium]
MLKKWGLILVLILVLAGGLRLWQANTFDIYTDQALYAFRALSWSDFMGVGDKQTTPLQWYQTVPSWSRLSFSDGPPLGFAVEYISLNIFGTSPLTARLPFIIFSLLAILLLFWGVRRLASERAALLATFVFAISSYSVWTALAGNLEGLLILFVAGAIIFPALYRQEGKMKWFYAWVICLGLGFLTKYTFIFALPAGLLMMWWPLKVSPKLKHLFFGFLILILLLSPVLIYNYNVYQTRGHFDAALSSMIGMHPEDFVGIANRGVTFNPLANLADIGRTLAQNNSVPFLALVIVSLIYLLYLLYRRRASTLSQSLLTHSLFLVLMFLFLSPATRFLSVFIPIIAVVVAVSLDRWWEFLAGNRLLYRYIFTGLIILILTAELFYSLNTNVFTKPVLTSPWFYAPDRYYDHGFYQAEQWWRQNLYPILPASQQLTAASGLDLMGDDFAGRPVIIYDDSIIWFGRIWHFERYKAFYRLPIIPVSYLIEQGPKANSFLQEMLTLSGQPSYFIYAPNQTNLDSIRATETARRAYIKNLADSLRRKNGPPAVVIKDYQGETALEIYQF